MPETNTSSPSFLDSRNAQPGFTIIYVVTTDSRSDQHLEQFTADLRTEVQARETADRRAGTLEREVGGCANASLKSSTASRRTTSRR